MQDQSHDIKILVMDVDGTLTDGKIHIGENGEMFKSFSVKDGYGIVNLLPQKDIVPVVITGRSSKIVEKRCKELNIHYLYQGVKDKLCVLDQLLKELNYTYDNVAIIGDDMNDYTCIQKAAVSACPQDSVNKVKEIVDYVLESQGGQGAVREFIELL